MSLNNCLVTEENVVASGDDEDPDSIPGEPVDALFVSGEFRTAKSSSEIGDASTIAQIEIERNCSVSEQEPETSELAAEDFDPSEAPSPSEKKIVQKLSPSVESKEFLQHALSVLRADNNHVFLLSEAGKPIYSRHGKEEDMASLMGVMQALTSFLDSQSGERLDFVRRGGWTVVFMHKAPLILVAAARGAASPSLLRQRLYCVYYHVLSVLTRTQLTRIFDQRKNFDLRRLLSGTEKTLHSLLDTHRADPSLLLCAVRCLPLPASTRESIGQAIISCASKVTNLVFAMVLARSQLVTMVRMRKYTLHPGDVHLLINLVLCNPSFRNAESWSPICLPRFDDTGFLHAHISYVSESLCVLMLAVDRNAFYALSDVRAKLIERLNRMKLWKTLADATAATQGISLHDLGIADLWHFVYKNRTSSQLCCSTWEPPYVSAAEVQRLVDGYLETLDRMLGPSLDQQTTTPPPPTLRMFYRTGDKEAIIGWVTPHFELYAALNPTVTKQAAVTKVDKLMKWLKKEEDRLFILNPQVF